MKLLSWIFIIKLIANSNIFKTHSISFCDDSTVFCLVGVTEKEKIKMEEKNKFKNIK